MLAGYLSIKSGCNRKLWSEEMSVTKERTLITILGPVAFVCDVFLQLESLKIKKF